MSCGKMIGWPIFCFILSGCVANHEGFEINFAHEATYKIGESEQEQKAAAGDKISISDLPVLVHAEGKNSLLIVPSYYTEATYKLALSPSGQGATGAQKSEDEQRKTNELLAEVVAIQGLLSESKADKALDKVQRVQKDFPDLAFLSFLEASCQIILGQKEAARKSLGLGLQSFPEHKEARALYLELGGKIDPKP